MKKPRRKPPKKVHPKQPKIDDDLAELASVLDEYRIEQNAEGWFAIPWLSGWNATQLALSLMENNLEGESDFLERACKIRASDPSVYEVANQYLQKLGRDADDTTYCALRCLQVTISNSSGGGEVFNTLLSRGLRDFPPEVIAPFVLEWRCQDAIRTSVSIHGDRLDRYRRAFRIAWERGLFLAAYAIKPTAR